MKRRFGMFVLAGLLVPLAMAAQASGQGATLSVNVATATPGQVIMVTGTGYNPSSANITGGVDIRLNTRDSEPLATSIVSPQNTISAEFPLPPTIAPGEYLLIATQVSTRGRHTFGTPGRAKIRVVAARGAAGAPGGGLPGDLPPVALAGSILALLALTGGIALCARRLRTSHGTIGG